MYEIRRDKNMESRELSTLNKAEKLIALLKEDKELREKLKSDNPEVRREVLDKVELNPDELEEIKAALEAISVRAVTPGFWG